MTSISKTILFSIALFINTSQALATDFRPCSYASIEGTVKVFEDNDLHKYAIFKALQSNHQLSISENIEGFLLDLRQTQEIKADQYQAKYSHLTTGTCDGFIVRIYSNTTPNTLLIELRGGDIEFKYLPLFEYLNKEGIPESIQSQIMDYYLNQSNRQGQLPAEVTYELGTAFIQGILVDLNMQNNIKGLKMVLKSAKQGYVKAQLKMGDLYRYGDNLEQDNIKALTWYMLAKNQGAQKAVEAIKEYQTSENQVNPDKTDEYQQAEQLAEKINVLLEKNKENAVHDFFKLKIIGISLNSMLSQ